MKVRPNEWGWGGKVDDATFSRKRLLMSAAQFVLYCTAWRYWLVNDLSKHLTNVQNGGLYLSHRVGCDEIAGMLRNTNALISVR